MVYKNLLTILLFFLLISCSDNLSGGSGDDISNGYISGIISKNDSSSTNGTIIKLLPIDFNPTIDIIPNHYLDTANNQGEYILGPIDSGSYNLISFSSGRELSALTSNIHISNRDTSINHLLDTSITISIMLPESLYINSTQLYIIGFDNYTTLSQDINPITFSLPKNSFTNLVLTNSNFSLEDTLVKSIIQNDTNVLVIDSTNFISSSFNFWSFNGIPQDTPIDLLKDSSNNIWAIFEDRIVGIILTDIDSLNIVNYDKSILGTNINKITCATISPWGSIFIGTKGQGMLNANVNSDGVLTAFDETLFSESIFLTSDTVASLGFKDDSTIFVLSSDTVIIGNYLKNTINLTLFTGQNSNKGFFFYDSLLVLTSNGFFRELNVNTGSFSSDIINFDQNNGIITSFNKGDDNHVYLGLEYTNGKEAVFFDGQNSLIHRYNLSIVPDSIIVKSATNDLNNYDLFGMSSGDLIYVINNNESEAKVINNTNSKLLSQYGAVGSLVVDSNNYLFAAVGKMGFAIIDLNTLP